MKPLQLVGQVAEFKFESKFWPLPVIWQFLWRLFHKVIEGWEGKISSQALGAALLLCLHRLDWQAQTWTQGIAKSAAVAAGSGWLALGKHATTLAILNQFKSQQGFMLCKFQGATSHFFFHVKWKFQWNRLEVVANQSSSHCFAQSFYQSHWSLCKNMT